MARKNRHAEVVQRLREIALGRANDIVKLAFVETGGDLSLIDGLDLTLLSEVKRSANGAVELKLIDRLEAMQLLLSESGGEKTAAAAEFYDAMDRAAQRTRDGQ